MRPREPGSRQRAGRHFLTMCTLLLLGHARSPSLLLRGGGVSLCLRDLVAGAWPLSLVVSESGNRSMATVPLGLGSRDMVTVRGCSVSWWPEDGFCPGEAGIRVLETWV